MKKVIYNVGFIALMSAGVFINAQTKEKGAVGINTQEPQATLDVRTFDVDGTTNEGVIAPKLTKERVANIATPVEGTLVYVTKTNYSGTNTAVAKIDDKGYYYFDGTEWVKAKGGAAAQTVGAINGLSKNADNIELGGSLTKATNIDQAGNNLTITGDGNVGIGTDNPSLKLDVSGAIRSSISKDHGPYLELKNPLKIEGGLWRILNMTNGYTHGLQIWNYGIDGTAPLSRMMITDEGKVGIGISGTSAPTAVLDINGNVRIRTIEEGNPDKDQVLLADEDGNIKKAAAGSLGATYTGSTSIALNGNSFERAALSGDVTADQNSNAVTVNAIQGKSISDATPTDGQILQWENNAWTPASVNTENLYTNNGTLAGDRTVTQNNNNLTFSTGTTGKFILEGNAKIASTVSVAPNTAGVSQLEANGLAATAAAGRTIRVYNGSDVPDYADSDYMIVLTNDGVNGNLELPSAKDNPGRIIYLINGTKSGLGFSGVNRDSTSDNLPFNFATIATRAGVGFVSTGKTWYTIGR